MPLLLGIANLLFPEKSKDGVPQPAVRLYVTPRGRRRNDSQATARPLRFDEGDWLFQKAMPPLAIR